MEIVDSNRGMMYVWAALPLQLGLRYNGHLPDCGKAEKGPIELQGLTFTCPASQDDPNPVPSFEACIERAKEVMDWNWHPAGTKTA